MALAFGQAIDPGRVGNYTLGKGRVFLSELNDDDTPKGGMRYVGNTPALSITIEGETHDHFSSESGINVKDDSVTTSITRTGTMTVDDITPANLAMFMQGSVIAGAQAAVNNAVTESFDGIKAGDTIQLGASANNLLGARNVTVTEVAIKANQAAYGNQQRTVVTAAMYKVDKAAGLIHFIPNQTAAGNGLTYNNGFPVLNIEVAYTAEMATFDRVQTGSESVQRRLVYRSENARGKDFMAIMSKCTITASGDFAVKGDDWMSMDVSLEILDPAGDTEAIVIDWETDQ